MDPNRGLRLRYRGPIWTAGGIPDTGTVCGRIFRGIALFCLQKYSMKSIVIGQRIDIYPTKKAIVRRMGKHASLETKSKTAQSNSLWIWVAVEGIRECDPIRMLAENVYVIILQA